MISGLATTHTTTVTIGHNGHSSLAVTMMEQVVPTSKTSKNNRGHPYYAREVAPSHPSHDNTNWFCPHFNNSLAPCASGVPFPWGGPDYTSVARTTSSSSSTSEASSPTLSTHSTTSNSDKVNLSHILPAVLVPLAVLNAVLAAFLLIWRSRRRKREKKTAKRLHPFIFQATNEGRATHRISVKEVPQHRERDITVGDIIRGQGEVGTERESRTSEETSDNHEASVLREQMRVLQSRVADIEAQHLSPTPPAYDSINQANGGGSRTVE